MTTRTHTYYTVSTHVLREFPGSGPFWSENGSGPGGRSIEEAQERVRKDMVRAGIKNLNNQVKFVIKKTVELTEVIEEVNGAEASFFMLKGQKHEHV
jgi:hypothetical protein